MACNGPDGTRWSSSLQACVSVSGGSSCDEGSQSTCWYGYLDLITRSEKSATEASPPWFSGKIEEEGFRIYMPDQLEGLCGLHRGELVHQINGRRPSERILRGYGDPNRPARFAELRRNSNGEVNLILKH